MEPPAPAPRGRPSQTFTARDAPQVPNPSPAEGRRREPRFAPTDDLLWMQWWHDGEHNGLPARLINVSRHGAMIVTRARLGAGMAVHIYLESAGDVGARAHVLAVVEGVEGLHQVRLEFPRSCPDEFFEAATCGFEGWLQHVRH